MRDHLLDAVRMFARTVVNPFDVDDLLDRLIEHTMLTLDAEGAGIMLVHEGRLGYAAASSELVATVERIQEDEETGACYEAFRSNQLIAVTDLREERRWPAYTRRALDIGLLSVIGVPLNALGSTIGVLNVYRSEASEWNAAQVDACEILGALGAAYVLNASQLHSQRELTGNLHLALSSRGTIERAKGIVMANDGVDEATAFKTLRKSSMDLNRKLRDVAQDVIDEAAGE